MSERNPDVRRFNPRAAAEFLESMSLLFNPAPPSTGLLGIYVLSQMCKRISVFGFSLEECRSAGCSRN